MKTTVDIPDELLQGAMRRAQTSEPREAMLEALKEYVGLHGDQRDIIPLLGTFSDEFLPPEELEKMRSED